MYIYIMGHSMEKYMFYLWFTVGELWLLDDRVTCGFRAATVTHLTGAHGVKQSL